MKESTDKPADGAQQPAQVAGGQTIEGEVKEKTKS